MHICIVGSGASGWLAANQLKERFFVDKVTVIGSPKIPHIGVGESTTLNLPAAHLKFHVDNSEFIREAHAAVKYGVKYQGWSSRDFIHFFKSEPAFERVGLSARKYIMLLGNKDPETFIHDIYGSAIWKEVVQKNNVFPDHINFKTSSPEFDNEYPSTFHFDAGLYIEFLKKQAFKSKKIEFIADTALKLDFSENGYIRSLTLESGKVIEADYYVNTTGQNLKTKNLFKEEYNSLGNTLLTSKAVVYPLPFTDKKKQFHPYTVAKAMKYGWRWITPTWERIGTGYTFSENHVSVDEAINEFITDIGDKSIVPNVVDFSPRVNKQTYKLNSCSVGMASGFLEPLDAPGLSLTNNVIGTLEALLEKHYIEFRDKTVHQKEAYIRVNLPFVNNEVQKAYTYWTSFILNQYKTCPRLDTPFWVDQKEVKWDHWTALVKDINAYCDIAKNDYDVMMIAQTIASRDIQYYTPVPKEIKPIKLPESTPKTMHHLDYIESFHKLK